MKKNNTMKYLTWIFYSMLFWNTSAAQSNKKIIYSAAAPKPIGPYSQGILTNNTLYISGQIALDTAGKMDTSDITIEFSRILHNMNHILEAANMKYSNIVKTTIYLTDLKNFAVINELYAQYFKLNPPARETVEVKALPKGAHIEISAIAVQ